MQSKDTSPHVLRRTQVMLVLGSLTQTTPLSLSVSPFDHMDAQEKQTHPPWKLFLIHRDPPGKAGLPVTC